MLLDCSCSRTFAVSKGSVSVCDHREYCVSDSWNREPMLLIANASDWYGININRELCHIKSSNSPLPHKLRLPMLQKTCAVVGACSE